jgi:hypothetical protein
MKRYFLLPLVLLMGCGAVNAPAPATAPTFYSQAALQINNFSVILQQAQTLFANAHTSGLVSDADFKTGEAAILAIAKNADTVDGLLTSSASQTSIVAAIQALGSQVAATPGLAGIKNPQSQAEFTALFTALNSILNASLALVQPGATS